MHCVIEGSDGAGKSTVVAGLVRELKKRGRPVVLVDKHYQVRNSAAPSSLTADLVARFRELQPVTYGPFPDGRHLWGDHHWLFQLGAWYSLLDTTVVRPALDEGLTVLVDSAHYKTLARYILKPDFPVELAWQVFANLRSPELVALLEVDPAVALRRKGGFAAIEAGFVGPEADAFIRHQGELQDVLRAFANRWGWRRLNTSTLAEDEVLANVLGWLDKAKH